MIANLNTSIGFFGETQNTLNWADRTKQIRTKACKAQGQVQPHENRDEQANLLLQTKTDNQMRRLQLSRLEQRQGCISSSNTYQATPSMPFTPMVGQWSVLRYPGEQPSQVDTWARRADAMTFEQKKIWELQRRVELLEMEVEKSKLDSVRSKGKILAPTHAQELKRKDEAIRNLAEANKDCAPVPPPVSKTSTSPIKCLERMLRQRFEASSHNDYSSEVNVSGPDRKTEASEKVRGYVISNVAATKGYPILQSKTSPRVTRRMTRSQQVSQQSPGKTPSKNPFPKRFSSLSKAEEKLAACRKRTFLDISNSPNSHLGSSGSLPQLLPKLARTRILNSRASPISSPYIP